MSRRRIRHVIALLLPLMVLRALLPAGFMPVAEHGELRMVLCSAGLQLPADGDDRGGHELPADLGNCVFAQAATGAPPAQHVAAVVEPLREARFLSVIPSTLPPGTGPPRAATARAPPASLA